MGGESTLKEKLQTDLKTAMKAGDKLRLMTVRGILSEITRLEKDVRRDPPQIKTNINAENNGRDQGGKQPACAWSLARAHQLIFNFTNNLICRWCQLSEISVIAHHNAPAL